MPGHIVARLPESEAIMPLRILRSRANHAAVEPESAERIQLSGKRFDNSQKTYWGLIGDALLCALASSTFHQRSISLIIFSCQLLSSFRLSKGINSRNVSLLSPCNCTSIG